MSYIGDLFKMIISDDFHYLDHYLNKMNKLGIDSNNIIFILIDSNNSMGYKKID